MITHLLKIWKEQKNVILVCFSVLILGMIAGIFVPESAKQTLLLQMSEKVKDVWTDNQFLLFLRIFLNNFLVGALMLLLGFSIIIPLFILFTNGVIISIVVQSALTETSALQILLLLLPHGIFEIPALIITSSLGIAIGFKLFSKKFMPQKTLKEVIQLSILRFISVCVLLFLIAAFVESFISPLFVL